MVDERGDDDADGGAALDAADAAAVAREPGGDCFERPTPRGRVRGRKLQKGDMPCCHFSHRGPYLWGAAQCFAMVRAHEREKIGRETYLGGNKIFYLLIWRKRAGFAVFISVVGWSCRPRDLKSCRH